MPDLATFLSMASCDQAVDDEVLGAVRFRYLTVWETMDLSSKHEGQERVLRMVHAMLAKVDPSLSYEQFLSLPDPVAARYVDLLTELVGGFRKRPPSS